MSVPGPPPKAPQTPKGDGEHYKSGLQKFVRRAFDVLLSAAGLLGIHGLIHFLLFALGVDTTEPVGKFVDKSVRWLVAGAFVIYVARLLISDASEQIAEAYTEIKSHWTKTGKPGVKK